ARSNRAHWPAVLPCWTPKIVAPPPPCARRKYCKSLPKDWPMTISPDTALVLFSGGQDSTVCLAWALARFARVETIGFDYGQRHAIELAVRQPIRDGIAKLNADWASRLKDD